MTRRPVVVAMLASAWFAVAASAQAPRQPAFGTVADIVGKPVAGAEVVLWWTPFSEPLGPATDRVTATTDARGRFTAQLLPQRAYSAFARGRVLPDGSTVLSFVREGVAAHAEVTLALTIAVPPRTARLRGAEAWAAEGPLRLAALPTAANVLRVDLPLVDGRAALPPLPSLGGVVVFDAQGEPLRCQLQNAATDEVQVDLPPPYVQRVRVLDEHGAPVAGAELLFDLGPVTRFVFTSLMPLTPLQAPAWRRVGASGADGTATLRLPVMKQSDEAMFTLVARRDARASVSACDGSGWFVNGFREPRAADGVLPLWLQAGQRLRVVQAGRSLAAEGVSVFGGIGMTGKGLGAGTSTSMAPFGQRGGADADGWIAPWPGGSVGDFRIRLDPLVLPGESVATVVDARIVRARGDVTVDLDRLRHLRVQVVEANGGPAVAVPVFVLCHERKLRAVPPCCADAAGRIDLRLGDGGWLVFAWSGDSLAMKSLAANAGDADWRLTMAPLPRMQLRVVDAQGRPLVGARAGLRWGEERGGSQMPQPANDEEALLLQLEQVVMQRICIGRYSGADGRLDVPLLPFARIAWEVEVGDGPKVVLPIEPTTDPTIGPREVVLR
jgi:hypothetical protein